jgi:hypothetical protein
MKRYVKFSGDNCIDCEFVRNKPYVVKCDLGLYVEIAGDCGGSFYVSTSGGCNFLGGEESWVFCDEHGNELDDKKKQGYKGQFDLAARDICTPRFVDKKGSVVSYGFNVTEALKRIAVRAG